MNRVCKIYVKNVKSAFPIIGKSERLYIKKLQNYLEEYCNEYNISSLEELYKNFGTPDDVINSYFVWNANNNSYYNIHKLNIVSYVIYDYQREIKQPSKIRNISIFEGCFYSSISLSTCYYSSKYSSKQIPLLIISFAAVLPTYL